MDTQVIEQASPPPRRASKWAFYGLVIGLLMLATAVKLVHNVLYGDFPQSYSFTVAEARDKGTLVREMTAQPPELTWRGVRVHFNEVWLARRAIEDHFLVWWPYFRGLGGYDLCFTLDERSDQALRAKDRAFFVLGEGGRAFGTLSGPGHPTLYSLTVPAPDGELEAASIVGSWKDAREKHIRFTAGTPK